MTVDIQYVRLDEDVCEAVNRIARAQLRTVSELVNQIVREQIQRSKAANSGNESSSGRSGTI